MSVSEMSRADIERRVLAALKKCIKIESYKMSLSSHFKDDLGMDSQDHVEIQMVVEDEFGIEIPDNDAGFFVRPNLIVDYIASRSDAK